MILVKRIPFLKFFEIFFEKVINFLCLSFFWSKKKIRRVKKITMSVNYNPYFRTFEISEYFTQRSVSFDEINLNLLFNN